MNNEITNLVELIFDISTLIPDQKYMDIMTSIGKINNYNNDKNTPNEHELLYYKLLKTHNRLKRDNRRIAKKRKEQFEAMEQTIEDLQHEVLYLQQNRPKLITGNDFISV